MVEPVAPETFIRRTTAPIHSDLSRGSRAATAARAHASTSVTCARSCSSSTRMYAIRLSMPRSINRIPRWRTKQHQIFFKPLILLKTLVDA